MTRRDVFMFKKIQEYEERKQNCYVFTHFRIRAWSITIQLFEEFLTADDQNFNTDVELYPTESLQNSKAK